MWGGHLSGADLSKANLTHADLRRTVLKRVRLDGARLNHANLGASNLDQASLRGAELVGVSLRGASLKNADLRAVLTQPLIPSELRGSGLKAPAADLHGADLRGADLRGADLRGADLGGATLSWANLDSADLRGANLRGAELSWTRLLEVDLRGASLRGAEFKGAMCSSSTRWPQGFSDVRAGAFRLVTGRGTDEPSRLQHVQVPGYGPLALVMVPSGTFSRGDDDGFSDEMPTHTVRLSRGFLIGQTPVTQGLYQAVMGENPSEHQASSTHPVECVSWFDAARFCNALSDRCGLERAYAIGSTDLPVSCRFDARGFRLPTEAEWEYAARSGEDAKYSGSSRPERVSWYRGSSGGQTRSVGLRQPNAWGIHDLSGNVYEWTWDWYDGHEYSRFSNSGCDDPCGPQQGSQRVLRGGAFGSSTDSLRLTFRCMRAPADRAGEHGLRVVLPVLVCS